MQYSDLCNTMASYDRAEQFMQAQLQGTSNQSSLATTEIVQLQAQVRNLEGKNQELSESSRLSKSSSSYEMVPDDKLYVPRTTFDKLVASSKNITGQYGDKLAQYTTNISQLEFSLAQQKNHSMMLQEEVDRLNDWEWETAKANSSHGKVKRPLAVRHWQSPKLPNMGLSP